MSNKIIPSSSAISDFISSQLSCDEHFVGVLPIDDLDIEEKEKEEKFSLWLNENETYIPAVNLTTEKTLPKGIYKISWNDHQGRYELKKHTLNTDDLIKFDNANISPILNEINSFWNKKDLYKKFGLMHKRALLLSGSAGTGNVFAVLISNN